MLVNGTLIHTVYKISFKIILFHTLRIYVYARGYRYPVTVALKTDHGNESETSADN